MKKPINLNLDVNNGLSIYLDADLVNKLEYKIDLQVKEYVYLNLRYALICKLKYLKRAIFSYYIGRH
jgi:hypothetical protein